MSDLTPDKYEQSQLVSAQIVYILSERLTLIPWPPWMLNESGMLDSIEHIYV